MHELVDIPFHTLTSLTYYLLMMSINFTILGFTVKCMLLTYNACSKYRCLTVSIYILFTSTYYLKIRQV